EFAPLEIVDLDSDDEYDPLFDDDPPPRKKKGKEKAVTPKTLKTVCAMCKDPLVMGATTEDRRNYALRCGHIVDGKCLWNIAKPAGAQEPETMEAEHDIDDQPIPGPSTAPQLDLSDPFFPTLREPISNRKKTRRNGRNETKLKSRKVPKSRGKLREELFEWTCPVPDCGRQHLSVRLLMEGAKWKCDPEKGAVLMFV
ncbi:10406_t:CDS:2, partial [Acaulospora colombiana]